MAAHPSPKKTWKLLLFDLPFWTLIISLVVAALLTLALRLALPKLNLAQDDLLLWLNNQLNFNANLQELNGQLNGINPQLAINNLQLAAEDQADFLQLETISLEIDTLASLFTRTLLVKKLNVQGLQLWLEQTPNGWQLANLPKTANKQQAATNKISLEEFLARLETLLSQGEINLTNLELHLKPLNESPVTLNAASVGYNRYAQGWQFNFELANSQTPEEKAEILLNLEGSKLNPANAKINAWFNLPQINLSDYQHLWPKSWSQDILTLEGKLALQGWFNLHHKKFNGHLEANELSLSQVKLNQQNNQFALNQATLSFNGTKNNWQASWNIQNLAFNSHQFNQLEGRYTYQNQQQQIQVKQISLDQLSPLAQELTTSWPYLHETLTTLNPEGKLTNLNFNLAANNTWQLEAQLNQVGVNAWAGAPLGKQVNGYLAVNNQGGEVVFISPELELGFPNLYPFNWQFNLAKGRVFWRIEPDNLWVIGEDLAIELPLQTNQNNQPPIQVSGEFAFHNNPSSPSFYLNLGLLPTSVTAQQQLVPSLLMPEEVADWLYNALPQGEVSNTAFIFAGPLSQPRFELATNFAHTEFAFQPDWPHLKQATGRFQLDNGLLKGAVESATLGEAQLNQASFATSLNTKAETLLNLSTHLNTPTHAFNWLVANSPLKQQIPSSIQHWQFGGQLTGQLELGLNLSNLAAEPEIELTSQLSQASLNLSQIDLLINDINGPLNFSLSKGFESSGLSGRLYGEFIQAKFLQPSNQLEFTSALSAASLGSYLGFQPKEEILNGYTLVKGKLPLTPLGELTLTSPLYGLGYDLLPGLSKHPNSNRYLEARLNLAEDLTPLNVKLSQDLSLTAVFLTDSAQLDFSSRPIQGQLIFPLAHSNQGYQLNLDHLKLPPAQPEKQQTAAPQQAATSDPLANFQPSQLKPFSLTINQLYRGDNLLGSLKAELTPTPTGFEINPLEAKLKASQLNAQLSWQQNQQTHFSGQIKGKDLAPSFRAFTSEELPLTSKEHQLNWQVNWPASPLHFQLANAEGEFNLNFKDGNFTNTSGGVNTLSQLFSLLNIDSLFRRLKLDFSDLNNKGVSYSSIKGSYQLNNGLLTNSQPTEVKSSATRLTLNGEINLLTQELNQELKLVLPVAQSLPLAAILVGAPQIGAGIWLTQKIFGKSLDKFTQASYTLSGPLADPEVKLKRVF